MSAKEYKSLDKSKGDSAPINRTSETFHQDWQAAINALQQVQGDYSHARKQLEDIYTSFSERERIVSERVKSLMDTVAMTSAEPKNNGIETRVDHSMLANIFHPSTVSFRVYCFGNFEIYQNWTKLDKWPSLKAKSLLKFLISRRRKSTQKDILIETLWPNCDPEVGNHNLKSAIYSLRQTLSKNKLDTDTKAYYPFVLFSEGRYMLAPNMDLWLDVDEFEQLWLNGRQMEKEGKIEEATNQYRAAEELYRGDYLEDEPYAEWTLIQRESLKDTYLTILGKLASTSFSNADYENCIIYCQKILVNDMCHEEAYRWLIRCYNHLGQRHRAKQWYDICVTTLKRELDAMPDLETVTLYNQLFNHK